MFQLRGRGLSIQSRVEVGFGLCRWEVPGRFEQAPRLAVAGLPTAVFSNPPDNPTLRGRALPLDCFCDLRQGAREDVVPESADYILTG